MLVFTKYDRYVSLVAEGDRFTLDDGTVHMPAYAGWAEEGYAMHELQQADPVPEGYAVTDTKVQLVGNVWKYVNTLVEIIPPTIEEIRANMPRKSMVDFRKALREIEIVVNAPEDEEAFVDGIYEEDILDKINLIADRKLRAEARDYFLYAEYIERTNPWVDVLGGMFGISPDRIDTEWMKDQHEPWTV